MAHGLPESLETAGEFERFGVGRQIPRSFSEGQRRAGAMADGADAVSQKADGRLQ